MLVGSSGGFNGHGHTLDLVHLVVIDFRENDLFTDTQGIVPASIKGLRIHALKVTNARKSDVHQTIQELIHTSAAQSHHNAHSIAFADLEGSNSLPGASEHRLLTGDRHNLLEGAI